MQGIGYDASQRNGVTNMLLPESDLVAGFGPQNITPSFEIHNQSRGSNLYHKQGKFLAPLASYTWTSKANV